MTMTAGRSMPNRTLRTLRKDKHIDEWNMQGFGPRTRSRKMPSSALMMGGVSGCGVGIQCFS